MYASLSLADAHVAMNKQIVNRKTSAILCDYSWLPRRVKRKSGLREKTEKCLHPWEVESEKGPRLRIQGVSQCAGDTAEEGASHDMTGSPHMRIRSGQRQTVSRVCSMKTTRRPQPNAVRQCRAPPRPSVCTHHVYGLCGPTNIMYHDMYEASTCKCSECSTICIIQGSQPKAVRP